MCEEVYPEIVNVESSNIISNDFVDRKPEENETSEAIAKKDNKSSTQSYNKFGGNMKFLKMYIISNLKFQILQLIFVFNMQVFNLIFFIQMQNNQATQLSCFLLYL